jgi:carnitine-CoA ligase
MDTLPLAERVAGKILAQQAAVAGERPFIRFQSRWTTYAEANRRANKVANALVALKIEKGSRVAILLKNRLEYLDLWFGLSKLGAVQVPINNDYRAPQIVHLLRRTPVDVVVVEPSLLGEMVAALAQFSPTPTVLIVDPMPSLASKRLEATEDFAAIVAEASDEEPVSSAQVSGADLAAIVNTSGTTGPSKGVCLSHAQQYILGRNIAADMELSADDVYYNFFPLFHNTAQAMITMPVLLCGAKMVLADRFSASRFWPEIIEDGCTAFYYIGEMMRILLKMTAADDARGSRLRIGWGIGASARDFIEFQSRFGVTLGTGYGSTEANVPCYLPRGSTKTASVGCVVPGFEIRIANQFGEPVPAGTAGEILIRSSEPYAEMLGYDSDPGATVVAWKDLWFHSGDTGYVDADGDLFFMGRVKDSIRVRGENISAFEVEEVISAVEGVLEVAAIAVPSELGGDDLKIVVVARDDAKLTPEKLIAHAQSRLPRYSIPRYVEFVPTLPKTATNKVQKHVLRSQPFTPGTWDLKASGVR